MPIAVNLDVMLARRKMRSHDLAISDGYHRSNYFIAEIGQGQERTV